MSSILEALKKLEEEKAARRGGVGNIAGKVTATGRRTRQRPPWLLPAAVAAVAVAASLSTYALMGGFSQRHGGAVTSALQASQAPAVPAPQAAAPDGMPGAAPDIQLPAPQKQEAPPGSPAPTVIIQAPPPPASAARHPIPASPSRREIPAEKNAPPPQPIAAEELPGIGVTGIAWQKDSTSRLAVVNGVSVAEGGMVEGVEVKEILPDRVRFSFKRKEFEVQLGKEP